MAPKPRKTKQKTKPYEGLSDLKGSRLSKQLREIESSLKNATKASDFPGFATLINELRKDQLLKSDKKEIKYLMGSIGVEIFRLSDGMDLNDEESREWIGLILKSIRVLENSKESSNYDRSLQMYNTLYDSSVLQVLVNVDECCELSNELVNIIMGVWCNQSIEDVDDISMRLMLSLLSLYKHVPNELIDLLSMKLIKEEEKKQMREVFVAGRSYLSGSVQQFYMNLLCESSLSESCYECSEHLYQILVELSSISGDYVSVLLPLVTQQFKVDNDKSRYEVVHCLSEVFSNPAIDYMKQNEGCFKEYCSRFQDRSADIRVLMCESTQELIQCQPSAVSTMVPLVKERLKDSQWEVRRAAVDCLCNIVNVHFDDIPVEVIYSLCERVLDKRGEVRKFAITGLVNILSIRGSDDWNNHRYINERVGKKVDMIAGMLIRCYMCCEDETRNRCSRLMNEILISNCEDYEAMGVSYLWLFKEMHHSFDEVNVESEESLLSFRGVLRDGMRVKRLLRSLLKEMEVRTPFETERVSNVLMSLSYALYLNQNAHSSSIPTYNTTNNCLYRLYETAVNDDSSRGEIIQSLSVLCENSVSLEEVKTIRKKIVSLIGNDEEGVRLQSQFKSAFHRLYCSLMSREMIGVYIELIANHSPLRADCAELLRVISEECSEVYMEWSIQVGIFGLFQQYLKDVTSKGVLKKKERKQWNDLLITTSNQSGLYEKNPLVLVKGSEWRSLYNEELVPLMDVVFDNLYTFPMDHIEYVIVIASSFCRFISSGDENTDRSIRIRYNEWVNEYLPGVSLKKDQDRVMIDLKCVTTLLRVDNSNCSHLGIRCLVDDVLNGEMNEESLLECIPFVCQYAVAVNRECDYSSRILEFLKKYCQFENESVRVKALCCLFRLGCVHCYAGFFTAELFYNLGECIESLKEESAISNIIHCISESIREKQLPLKYLCYIVECWVLNKNSRQLIIPELHTVITNQRKYLLYYQSNNRMKEGPPIYQLSPEYCLVYLLPLLSRLKAYANLKETPTKVQIGCVDVFISELLSDSPDSAGLINAILVSMYNSRDRLKKDNPLLTTLIVLCNQLVDKHIHLVKTVDVSYSESIRLPAGYYMAASEKRQSDSLDARSNKRISLRWCVC